MPRLNNAAMNHIFIFLVVIEINYKFNIYLYWNYLVLLNYFLSDLFLNGLLAAFTDKILVANL